MIGEQTKDLLAEAVKAELASGIEKYGYFHSSHEGASVLLEEMEEVQDAAELFNGRAMNNYKALWLKVKADDMTGSKECLEAIFGVAEEMAKECIQVMAMCVKWENFIEKERLV